MGINYELLYRCVIAVDILLCAAIIICNFILIFSILFFKRARARTRNVMLISMCLGDLMVGAFTHPIYIHSYHTGTLYHSCEMHIVMQLIGDYSQDFVCFWTLVTLGSIYLFRLARQRWGWGTSLSGHYGRLTPPRSKCHTFIRVAKKALLVGWPWLGTLFIPIPILLANVEKTTKQKLWDETFCPLHTPFPTRILVFILVYYLPMAAILLLCVGIGLLMYWDMVNARSPRSSAPQPLVQNDALSGNGEEPAGTMGVTEGAERANGHPAGSPIYKPMAASLPTEVSDTDSGMPVSDLPHNNLLQSEDDYDHTTAPKESAAQSRTSDSVINTQDVDPSVILVGGDLGSRLEGGGGTSRSSASEGGGDAEPLERPVHMLVPFLVTVVCTLPLIIGWWFFDRLQNLDTVVVVSFTLSRLYVLRAALLPVAWFTLPELRHAAVTLWDRLNGKGARGSGPRREMGEFSVAYTTLRETGDAPRSASDGVQGPDVRRQNPFDTNVRV